jgi:hypothetical protein
MRFNRNNSLNPTRRAFNNVVADFAKLGNTNPQFSSTPVGGVRRFATPPVMKGIPGYRIQSAPGTGQDGYVLQSPKKQLISLAATFTDQLFNLSGTILWYLTSTNPTDQLLIRIGSIASDALPWGPGNGLEGIPFSQLFITNPVAVAGATATLVYMTDTPQTPARFF